MYDIFWLYAIKQVQDDKVILTGAEILKEWQADRIEIDPFYTKQINPNSYDFRLGSTVKVYSEHVLDARAANPTTTFEIPDEGLVLMPDRIYLGHTLEVMGSDYYVPIIRAKSSIARLGLFVHVTADLIDIGSHNQWTLQLHAVQRVKVYKGMLIGQVTFWRPQGEIILYRGKYQGSRGPIESLIHKGIPSVKE